MKKVLRLLLLLLVFITGPILVKAQVTASFSGSPTSGCAPIIFTATDASTPSGVSHLFIIYRDSTYVSGTHIDTAAVRVGTSSTASATFVLDSVGFYEVVDSAYNTSGVVSRDSMHDYVFVSNPILTTRINTIDSSTDTNSCQGHTITFINQSDTVRGCTPHFTWTISGGPSSLDTSITTTGRNTNVVFTFTVSGEYNVNLTETACSSCYGYPASSFDVHVQSFPVACFTNRDSLPCNEPAIVSFHNCSSGGAAHYLWKFGDGSSSTSSLDSITHTYDITGTIKDSLIAYSSFGCADTLIDSANIIIGHFNTGFNMTATSICAADVVSSGTVTCTDTTFGATAHYWHDTYTPHHTSTLANPTFTYSVAGTYIITDSAYNATGCHDTATRTITVLAIPTVSVTGNHLYRCTPTDTVTFTPTVADAAGISSFEWYYGDGHTLTGTGSPVAVVHNYTSSATFSDSLKVTDANGCANMAINSSYVKIGAPTFAISTTNDSGCAGTFNFAYTTSISSSIPYKLDSVKFGDGTGDAAGYHVITGDSTSGTHSYGSATSGVYTVTVAYTLPDSIGGCHYTDSITVRVGTTSPIYSPAISTDSVCPNAVFTVSCNCTNCTSFRWNFNGTSHTSFSGSYIRACDTSDSYSTAGEHYIQAIANDAGCTDTATDSIYVLAPAITFTTSLTTCANDSVVHFTALGSTGATGFHWDFGDGTTGTGDSLNHTYTLGAGHTYTVVLIDSATTGLHRCTNIDSQVIHIYPFTGKFSLNHTKACVGQVITDTASLTPYGTDYTYTWYFGDGTAGYTTNLSNIKTHTYTHTGYYTDTVIFKNTYGCIDTLVSSTARHDFDTIAGPSGGATANGVTHDTGCVALTALLSDNNTDFTGFTIASRHWNYNAPVPYAQAGAGVPDSVFVSGTASESVTYPEGVYTIILIDSDNIGCTVSDTVHAVSERPHAYFYSPDSSIQACTGVAIPFYDTNTHCTYSWFFGDGGTSTVQNPTHTYTANGTYTVKVVITTTAGGGLPTGCTDTFTRAAYINISTINIGFNLSETSSSCPPLYEFATNTTSPVSSYTYKWKITPFGEIAATTTNLSHVFLASGVYTVTLIDSSAIGCMDSLGKTVNINGPEGYLTFSTDSGCSPVNATLCFIDTNGITPSHYTWVYGDGNTYDTTASCVNHTYTLANTYHPSVLITAPGCVEAFPAADEVANTDSIQVFAVPVMSVTPTNPYLCYGKSVVLSVTGAGAGGSYSWSPGTGLSSTSDSIVTANPLVTTTYTITGTTIHGCTDTISVTIRVDTMLNPITITGKDSICGGGTFSDTLSASGGRPGGYTWLPSTGTILPPGDTIIVSATGGAIIYKAVYTDLNGCSDTSAPKSVQVNPLPSYIYGDSIVCQGDSTLFTDTVSGGMWISSNSGVASVDAGIDPSTYVSGASVGTATITYQTGLGCYRTKEITVKYAPGPIIGQTNVCYKDTIHLTDIVTSGGVWSSATPTVASVSQFTGIVGGITPGIATISFSVDNCPVTSVITVRPVPDSSYTPSGTNLYVCKYSTTGTQVTLTGADIESYQWFPNVLLSNDTISNPVLHDTADIIYKVTEKSIYGCIDTFSVPVTVYDSAYTVISADTSICIGKSAQLNALSTSDAITGDLTTYTWSPAATLDSATIHNPVATPDSTTTYTVNIYENPCYSAQRDVTVTVIPTPVIALPATETIVAGVSVQLTATITNGVVISQWEWTPSNSLSCDTCFNPIATPSMNTTYSVTATSPVGCVGSNEVTINIVCVEASQVFVPNTFTPNGDGNNDRFYLSGRGLGLITRMSIYNRWGEEVFSTQNINANEPGQGWDGTYRGQVLQPDVFVYVFELTCETGVPFTLKGDISLVR